MFKFCICDDSRSFVDSLTKMISELSQEMSFEYSLDTYYEIKDLDAAIRSGEKYNLIFQDIIFDENNGLDFAKTLRDLEYQTQIIFITTSKEYAIDCYDVSPLHFLLKPFEKDKLKLALNKFLDLNKKENIVLYLPGHVVNISSESIYYIEVLGHKIKIHTAQEIYEYTSSIVKLEDLLGKDNFFRCHKSFLINMKYVKKAKRYGATLENEEIIPIGKTKYNEFMDTYLSFVSKHTMRI